MRHFLNERMFFYLIYFFFIFTCLFFLSSYYNDLLIRIVTKYAWKVVNWYRLMKRCILLLLWQRTERKKIICPLSDSSEESIARDKNLFFYLSLTTAARRGAWKMTRRGIRRKKGKRWGLPLEGKPRTTSTTMRRSKTRRTEITSRST